MIRPLALIAMLLGIPSWGVAQQSAQQSEDAVAEARAHHLAGVEALHANDLETAEREFTSALELTFRASTAYNLALVLTEQKRAVEALALYERVLALADDELPRARADIEFDRSRAERLRGQIEVTIVGADSAEVRLDTTSQGRVLAESPLSLFADPGEHRLEAVSGVQRVSENLELEPGGVHRARLRFEPIAAAIVEPPTSERPHPRRRRRRILGWVIAGAALIAGGVVLAVALSDSEPTGGFDEPPFGHFDALSAF